MIDYKTIIQMIECRQRKRSWLARIRQREPRPSHVPMFQLWQTPEYLIYLIEKELNALVAAGASLRQAVNILAECFSLKHGMDDDSMLIAKLLEQHFPDFAHNQGAIVGELRAIAKNSLRATASVGYPPNEWLAGEITPAALAEQMGDRLERIQIFPRSEFDAQLLHFSIMSRLGGRLINFSSPAESWRNMMGRAGVALVKEHLPIAYIETVMN